MSDLEPRRRLAAILAADVVGYSRMMQADEAGTLAAVKSRRKEILQPLVSKHHGRIIKVMGDGVLVEFASAVEAVSCAVALQEAMAAANESAEKSRRIVLRIGVNLGDVLVEGSDLYGDGVNIAARLQTLSEPGAVAVSGKVRHEVAGKIDLKFEDLGEQDLKNIAGSVQVYRASATTPVTAGTVARKTPTSEKPSIAVLPFNNMSGDPEQEYFSDGITEDIITELSRNRALSVVARNSSFMFKKAALDVAELGRRLGARYVLEGSVRKVGKRVRITAQLIDSSSGSHVWAERYSRDFDDISEFQDEVAEMIAATTVGRVENYSVQLAERKSAKDLAAYDYRLRARKIRRTAYLNPDFFARNAMESARELLEQAIQIDPDYATAYAELAWTYMDEWVSFGDIELLEKAHACAQTSVRLEPADSTVLRTVGMSHLWLRRHEEATYHLGKALSTNPTDVMANQNMAVCMDFLGRFDDAKALANKAMHIDPYYWVSCRETLGYVLYNLGEYEGALAAFRSLDPMPIWGRPFVAACCVQSGRDDEARAQAAAYLNIRSPARSDSGIAIDRETRLRATVAYVNVYKNQTHRDNWFNAMRKAGIPV
jgi:TolB-like protein/Tfp pilus assembly protein PilF